MSVRVYLWVEMDTPITPEEPNPTAAALSEARYWFDKCRLRGWCISEYGIIGTEVFPS